jgi:hypothetical protein
VLAFTVTVAIAGFSIIVFGNFLPTVQVAQADSQFSQVASGAQDAVTNGHASVAILLNHSSISCSGGTLEFVASDGTTRSTALGVACSFSDRDLSGLCTLQFVRSSSGLNLEVTS